MGNAYFQFKHFRVEQANTPMKVGTDGVLLGAWTELPPDAKRLLDIGTGTGLIALMLAQRSPEQVKIHAIELEESAAKEAAHNFGQSKWGNRLAVSHSSLQQFSTSETFDLIVCNPPFFKSGNTAKELARARARHDDCLSLQELVTGAVKLLSNKGLFSLIIPTDRLADLLAETNKVGLSLRRQTAVYPNPLKAAKRQLLCFGKEPQYCVPTELTLETGVRHDYTEAFRALLKDFYLAF